MPRRRRTFAEPCMVQSDGQAASLQVVNLEELLVVLALYCNRDDEEATDALNMLYDLFAGEDASHIPRVRTGGLLCNLWAAPNGIDTWHSPPDMVCVCVGAPTRRDARHRRTWRASCERCALRG